MSLGPLYVLLGEVSVQVLCPFFNWIVYLPRIESYEFFIQFGDLYNGIKIVSSINGFESTGQVHGGKKWN